MLEQLKKIGRYLVTYKDPYAPDRGDTDWDIFEEYAGAFGCNWPKCEGMQTIAKFGDMKTFGKFLETLWAHAQRHGMVSQAPQKS